MSQGLREIVKGPVDLKILIAYFCVIFTSILVFTVALNQPYLKEAGLPIGSFGLLFLCFHLGAMGGSLGAKQLTIQKLDRRFFFLLALSFSIVLGGLAAWQKPASILLVAIVYLIWGLVIPTTSDATNRLISSQYRATVLSAKDFLQKSSAEHGRF